LFFGNSFGLLGFCVFGIIGALSVAVGGGHCVFDIIGVLSVAAGGGHCVGKNKSVGFQDC
jgi:hypothetical protein